MFLMKEKTDGTDVNVSCGKHWKYLVILNLSALLLLGMGFVMNVNAEQVERQDFGSGGIFSYVPPSGWRVSEFPGLKFKVSRGAAIHGFAPNIVIADETYDKSLDDYARESIANLQKLFQDLNIIDQSNLTTSDGTRVIRVTTERNDDLSKKRLRQVFYFYDAGNKKLVATCSALAEEAAATDLVCDASMKTFSVTPAK